MAADAVAGAASRLEAARELWDGARRVDAAAADTAAEATHRLDDAKRAWEEAGWQIGVGPLRLTPAFRPLVEPFVPRRPRHRHRKVGCRVIMTVLLL